VCFYSTASLCVRAGLGHRRRLLGWWMVARSTGAQRVGQRGHRSFTRDSSVTTMFLCVRGSAGQSRCAQSLNKRATWDLQHPAPCAEVHTA
jgi:hypothetical protein